MRLRLVVLLAALSLPARTEVLLERTFLPHGAAPSSFAVGLPGGVNFCFDPIRGGVNYVWTGDFLDLTPARPGPGKFVSAVKLLGPLVHRESGPAPLRHGDPTRVPGVEFSGYTVHADAIEFRYTLDGIAVRETIRARADGTALLRHFQVARGTDATWWRVVDERPPEKLPRGADGSFDLEIALPQAKQ